MQAWEIDQLRAFFLEVIRSPKDKISWRRARDIDVRFHPRALWSLYRGKQINLAQLIELFNQDEDLIREASKLDPIEEVETFENHIKKLAGAKLDKIVKKLFDKSTRYTEDEFNAIFDRYELVKALRSSIFVALTENAYADYKALIKRKYEQEDKEAMEPVFHLEEVEMDEDMEEAGLEPGEVLLRLPDNFFDNLDDEARMLEEGIISEKTHQEMMRAALEHLAIVAENERIKRAREEEEERENERVTRARPEVEVLGTNEDLMQIKHKTKEVEACLKLRYFYENKLNRPELLECIRHNVYDAEIYFMALSIEIALEGDEELWNEEDQAFAYEYEHLPEGQRPRPGLVDWRYFLWTDRHADYQALLDDASPMCALKHYFEWRDAAEGLRVPQITRFPIILRHDKFGETRVWRNSVKTKLKLPAHRFESIVDEEATYAFDERELPELMRILKRVGFKY